MMMTLLQTMVDQTMVDKRWSPVLALHCDACCAHMLLDRCMRASNFPHPQLHKVPLHHDVPHTTLKK